MVADTGQSAPKDGSKKNESKEKFSGEYKKKYLKWLLIAFGAIIFYVFFNPIVIIPAGHVGVIFNAAGGIDFNHVMTPGWNFRFPILQTVHKVYVERHTVNLIDQGGDDIAISAPTKEGLVVKMDVTVLFKTKPELAPKIVQQLSEFYVDGTIVPEVRSAAREITGDMSVTELYGPGRESLEDKIFKKLDPAFGRDGFILEAVLVRNIQLPPTIITAIEQKQATEQAVLQKQFEVNLAKKEAERKKIEAEGIAQSKIEIAKGESEALRLVADSIKSNPNVLKSKQLDVLQNLYTNPNVKWVLPSNQLIYPMNFDNTTS